MKTNPKTPILTGDVLKILKKYQRIERGKLLISQDRFKGLFRHCDSVLRDIEKSIKKLSWEADDVQ